MVRINVVDDSGVYTDPDDGETYVFVASKGEIYLLGLEVAEQVEQELREYTHGSAKASTRLREQ